MNNHKADEINDAISLLQDDDGLKFGTDALLLSAFTKRGTFMSTSLEAADLGSGTGAISLICAKRQRFSKIYAIEVQESFCDIIKKNTEQNGLSERVITIHSDVRTLSASDIGHELDVVFSNPPYMKADSGKRNEYDKKFIARHEVCGNIGDFTNCARRLLKHGGKFLCVFRPDRLEDLMYEMRKSALEPKTCVFVHAHPKADPSMVLIEAIKGGASGMRVTRPLFLSDSREDSINNIPSHDASIIYESGSFEFFLSDK